MEAWCALFKQLPKHVLFRWDPWPDQPLGVSRLNVFCSACIPIEVKGQGKGITEEVVDQFKALGAEKRLTVESQIVVAGAPGVVATLEYQLFLLFQLRLPFILLVPAESIQQCATLLLSHEMKLVLPLSRIELGGGESGVFLTYGLPDLAPFTTVENK